MSQQYKDLLNESQVEATTIRVDSLDADEWVVTNSNQELASRVLQGTANRVSVTTVGDTTTLSCPQDIATTSAPEFKGLKLSGPTPSLPLKLDSSGSATSGLISLTSEVKDTLPVASGGTGSSAALTNGKVMQSAAGAIVESDIAFTTAGATALTLPLSGTLATLAGNEIFSNKTFSNSVNLSYATASMPIKTDASKNLVSGAIDLGSEVSGTLPVGSGGTGSTAALANGMLMTSVGGAIVEGTSSSTPAFTGLSLSSLTASQPLKTDASKNLVSGLIALASDVSGTLPVGSGGTGSTVALANGKLMASVGGAIVEGTSSSTPAFTGMSLSGLTASMPIKTDASKNLTSGLINLTSDVTGVLPVSSGGTGGGSALTNGKIIVSSGGAFTEGTSSTQPVFTTVAATGGMGCTNGSYYQASTTIGSKPYVGRFGTDAGTSTTYLDGYGGTSAPLGGGTLSLRSGGTERINISATATTVANKLMVSNIKDSVLFGTVYDYYTTSQLLTVPDGVTGMYVKLWGAGGGGAGSNATQLGGNGGGGAYSYWSGSVTAGDTYYLVLNSSTFMKGGAAGGGGATIPGAGGAGSGLFLLSGGLYTAKCIAAGGGGGSATSIFGHDAHGGGGGSNGGPEIGGGSFPGGNTSAGGGAGGTSAGSGSVAGQNFTGDSSSSVFTAVDGSVGSCGNGIAGSGTQGGSGGGYGSGSTGVGAANNMSGGAAGGGSYSASGGGSSPGVSTTPANSSDADFVAIGGSALYAKGGAQAPLGTANGTAGNMGVAIVYYLYGAGTNRTALASSIVDVAGQLKMTASSNQIKFQTTPLATSMTLSASAPASSRVYSLPDVAVDTSFMMLGGSQTVDGAKTFSATLVASNTTDSSSTSTGCIVGSGGLGIAKKAFLGGVLSVLDATDSSSTGTGCTIMSGGLGLAKSLYCGQNIVFPNGGASNLAFYGETTFNATFSGIFSANPTITITALRVGNLITFRIPTLSAATTGSAAFFTSGAGVVPANYRPPIDVNLPILTSTTGAAGQGTGYLKVSSAGTITAYFRTDAATAWPNATTISILSGAISFAFI